MTQIKMCSGKSSVGSSAKEVSGILNCALKMLSKLKLSNVELTQIRLCILICKLTPYFQHFLTFLSVGSRSNFSLIRIKPNNFEINARTSKIKVFQASAGKELNLITFWVNSNSSWKSSELITKKESLI